MRSRIVWLVGIATLLIGAVVAGWVVTLRLQPDAAALLELLPPGAELYGVVDLEGLQSNPAIRKLLSDSSGNPAETGYDQFLRDSGFRYQNDLKQLAVAKLGRDWVGVAHVEADQPRIISYMESEGAAKFQMDGLTAYAFGTERAFRVVFLDDQRVAFTVGGEPDRLRQVVERSMKGSADSAAVELRRSGDPQSLPGDSELWVFGRLDQLFESDPKAVQLGVFQLGREWLQGSKTAHLRVESGPIQLEIQLEDRCDSVATAERIASWAKAMLVILKAPPSPQIQSSGPDYTPLLRAVSVRQERESVFLEWRWDPSMLALLNRDSR
jgi:hypothetical protein